ncbi:hypothetical protein D3C73_1099770 [compost metagenome]
MAFNHFALTHVLNVYAHPPLINRIPEYIAIDSINGCNLLLLHYRINILNLIPKLFRTFKIKFLSGGMHLRSQFFLNLIMSAIQETGNLLDHTLIGFIRNLILTGS